MDVLKNFSKYLFAKEESVDILGSFSMSMYARQGEANRVGLRMDGLLYSSTDKSGHVEYLLIVRSNATKKTGTCTLIHEFANRKNAEKEFRYALQFARKLKKWDRIKSDQSGIS